MTQAPEDRVVSSLTAIADPEAHDADWRAMRQIATEAFPLAEALARVVKAARGITWVSYDGGWLWRVTRRDYEALTESLALLDQEAEDRFQREVSESMLPVAVESLDQEAGDR
jgi:hypothetical protein